ncbi:hypothetical protein SDC9_162844 [bioreactor metagenome]|uniref:Uncharacterized protein n=1 Tax=bioreactor metagenome TaxID=1076179 RepID=A0A645FNJ5_9ZZZZ
MLLDPQLDIEVTGGAAAGADLALGGQVDPVAGVHPGGHLDIERPGGAHPSLPGALRAGVRDDRAVAAAGRARRGGPDVAEEGPLHLGDLAGAVTRPAGDRGVALGRAGATAPGAQHRGVDLQCLGRPEGRLGQGE